MIVGKADYLDKMENLLHDTQNLNNDGILNFTINQEKRADNIIKKLVATKSMSKETRRSLKPLEARPGIMYGLQFTKISSIIACLFDLFCQQLIVLHIN